MKYFLSTPVLRIFQSPCSNFILNVALQLTLSSGKICTSTIFSSCANSLNLTLPDVSNISKADYSCKSNKKKLEAPWRILFFGTDEFSVKSLQLLCAKYRTHTLISRLEVVSSEKGKHSPVIKFAKDENLVLHHWPIGTDLLKDNYDIGIVVSFGHLIPSKIINAFPLGMINVHGSILPRWRGAAPIVHAILHGDHETGISIIRLQPKHFDRGEIVRQYRCPITPHDTAGELHTRLAEVGGQLLLECVRDMPRCVLNAPPQPEEGATYAKKIDASYSLIDWNTMSSVQVYNLHRALGHVYPLLTQWNGVKVKLHNISLDTSHQPRKESMDNSDQNKESIGTQTTQPTQQLSSALSFLSGGQSSIPTKETAVETGRACELGLVTFDKQNKVIRIKCIDGKSVLCSQVTVSGKKKMSAIDFNNGFISKVKTENGRRFVNLDKQLMSAEKY
ncbi:hypothetical protein WDU94_014581 [Cyamophila willieti]